MKKINKILSIGLISMLLLPSNINALTKEETIYTNLNSDGTVIKSVVNNHIVVTSNEEITDETRLKDILNLNGKEKFNLDNQRLTWEGNSKDIFYQGVSEEELPIEVKITYYLNDEEINIDDLKDKEGNIRIKLDFINKSYDNKTGLYTPFVVTMGTILDKDTSNIEITNGRVVNTGNRIMAVSLASPGLYDSVGIDEFKNLDTIEIKYYTKKFNINDIYLIATPKLLSESDLNIFNKLDNLSSGVNTIQENMNKIEDGAKELENGSKKLKNGTSEISSSLNKAIIAINKLNDGSKLIDSSLKEVINNLTIVKSELENKDIEGSIAQLQELKKNNTNAINKLSTTNETILNTYNNYGLSNFNNTQELTLYFSNLGVSEEQIKQLISAKEAYEGEIYSGNSSLIELLTYNNIAIDNTINSLTELSNEISNLLTTLTEALSKIESGSSQVSNGLSELNIGINKLYQGSIELDNGMDSLSNGTTTLSNGISTLNTQGINELSNMSNNLNNYKFKVKNLIELSKNYKGYSSDNATDTIFIYKVK